MSVKLISLGLLAAVVLSGCSIEKKGNNGNENVDIQTPFGGMKVKTNDAAVAADTGIPVYPGATPFKQGHDTGAADVDMNFGSFHLRVKAVAYQTPDTPEKVREYYQKALAAKFGDVIECRGKQAVGDPKRTKDGLNCEDHNKGKVEMGEVTNNAEFQLKSGSPGHQHIVAVERKPDGTKLALIALDLPIDDKGNYKGSDSDGRVSN
jgi:hypothetical protein